MKQIATEKFWTSMAKRWQKIPCPGHPWPSEMKIYRQFSQEALRGVKPPKILILGSTPEMRDLAHSFKNAKVTCVDVSLDMILAMRGLMKHKRRTDKEIWVCGDWVNVPLAKNYYHLILGEAVLANVEFHLWSKFLKHLNDLLRPESYFVTRVVVIPEPWSSKDLDDVFQYVKSNQLNSEELRFLLYYRIWSPKVKALGSRDLFSTLKKFWQGKDQKFYHPDSYIRKLLNRIKENYDWPPKSSFRWSNRSQKVCEKYLKKYFTITNVRYGKGETPCPLSYHPIYSLKKK